MRTSGTFSSRFMHQPGGYSLSLSLDSAFSSREEGQRPRTRQERNGDPDLRFVSLEIHTIWKRTSNPPLSSPPPGEFTTPHINFMCKEVKSVLFRATSAIYITYRIEILCVTNSGLTFTFRISKRPGNTTKGDL